MAKSVEENKPGCKVKCGRKWSAQSPPPRSESSSSPTAGNGELPNKEKCVINDFIMVQEREERVTRLDRLSNRQLSARGSASELRVAANLARRAHLTVIL